MSEPATGGNGILQEMTINEVEQLDPSVVVFGIGSTEPHGPHLPYGTDWYQTDAVCRRAVRRANDAGARALMYPTLPIGNNVNQKGFPFACRITVRTLMLVVLDVIEALESEGIDKVVLVNGHGGNTATLNATLREHTGRTPAEQRAFVCLTSTTGAVPYEVQKLIVHPSDHAGEGETSRMLYLRPDLVNQDRFDEFPVQASMLEHLDEIADAYVPPWPGYLPASAGGETRESSAEKGAALIDGAADAIADLLVELTGVSVHELFPFPQGN